MFVAALVRFYFNGNEPVEDLCRYEPGGYHPVHLGDTFPNEDNQRYRILHKIGHGSFSTVWLASDIVQNRFVAIKFVVARLTGRSKEIDVLEELNAHSHPGASHIIKLHDHFKIQGPNGTHQVLVMDVLASAYTLRNENIISSQWRSISHQLLSALDFLQHQGILHGDLHFGNIGFKIPNLDQYTEAQLLAKLEYPELTLVLPRDPSVQSASLPKYIVTGVSIIDHIPSLLTNEAGVVPLVAEIMDFGSAFWLQDWAPLPDAGPPLVVRAPESTFRDLSDGRVEDRWSLSSDVWSMACTLYEIVYPFPMLRGRDHKLIYEMMKLLGPLPARWQPYWDPKPFEDVDGNLIIDPDAEWRRRQGSQKGIDGWVDLLRDMLRWEPEARPTATELLKHRCFQDVTLP